MTTSMQALDQNTQEIVARLMKMPESKRQRFMELSQLYQHATDSEEQAEILHVVIELVQPELLGITWNRGQVANPTENVDAEAVRSVAAYRKAVGRRIKAVRIGKKMTQSALADAAGLPQSHISRLEKGVHAATGSTIEKIARALGVDPGELDPSF